MASATVALGVSSSFLNSALEDELRAEGCDPFKILAQLAVAGEEETTRLAAAKELAKYLRPQLKSVDVKFGAGQQRQFAIIKFSEVDPVQAAALAKGLTPAALEAKIMGGSATLLDTLRRELEAPVVAEDIGLVHTGAGAVVEDDVPSPEDEAIPYQHKRRDGR